MACCEVTQFGQEMFSDRKDTSTSGSRFKLVSGGDSLCSQCDQRVYQQEKVVADRAVYHKWCFRCTYCNRILSSSNYTVGIGSSPYCKPHFLQLFKIRGNYESGFVSQKTDNDVSTNHSASLFLASDSAKESDNRRVIVINAKSGTPRVGDMVSVPSTRTKDARTMFRSMDTLHSSAVTSQQAHSRNKITPRLLPVTEVRPRDLEATSPTTKTTYYNLKRRDDFQLTPVTPLTATSTVVETPKENRLENYNGQGTKEILDLGEAKILDAVYDASESTRL